MLLFVLIGLVFAGPPVVLGPSGPTYLGPMPPGDTANGVVIVDPHSGALWVELPRASGGVRLWSGGEWVSEAEALTPENTPEGYDFEAARLITAPTAGGNVVHHAYDDQGRLTGLVWPRGEVVQINYDALNRVTSIAGPGPSRWTMRWGEGVRARDPMGRTLNIEVKERENSRVITVKDSLGRTAHTRFERDADREWRISGWQDPRGLDTHVQHHPNRLDVRDPAGRDWHLGLDGDGRVVIATGPDGHRWNWTRDGSGRVVRLDDPAGRSAQWERDEAGRVVAVTLGGRLTRYRRDKAGWVTQIVAANGSVTKLERDALGRISAVHDAAGNALYIQRHPNGWPSSITGRGGGRWEIGLDSSGQPAFFEGPAGAKSTLGRDGAGRLVKWTDPAHGEVRFGRTADGYLSRITDAVGRTLGLFRNGAGQVTRLLRPDGTALVMARNPAGDVVSVEVDGAVLKIERDPLGQAIRAGELVWTRDIVGRVQRIERPGLRLQLTRDPAGRLRSLRSGAHAVIVQRDAAGWPMIWSDGEDRGPDVIVQRDASGRVVVEQVGAQEVVVFRNSLGAVDRIKSQLGEWRWMRDASGQVLRLNGPEGLNIGLDRDAAGRVVLVRYPSGSIMRRVYKKNQTKETLSDSAGAVVDVRNTVRDVHGQLVQVTDAKGRGWTWRRDPNGQVVSVERSDGAAWSWTMDGVQGPEGELLLHDESGRMMEARMGVGPSAWGVAGDTMSVHRDSLGRMSRISGEHGAIELRWDAEGWLSGTRNPETGERWRFERDVRGRLCAVQRGDEQQLTLWHPDAERGEIWGLLATQTETGTTERVMGREGGGAVRTRDADDTALDELVVDVGGRPAWHMVEGEAPIALVATPLSRMNTAVPGGLAPGGTWTPWPGSPAFGAGGAIDPVSGESVDGAIDWPWATRFAQQDSTRRALDPAAWAPESPWTNPLALLTTLNILDPIDDGEWRSPEASPAAFAWLPDSLDSGAPPLGPAPGAMPMASVDPITSAFLRAVMPGGSPPSADLPRAIVMDAELGLPWLPPGVAVPGLRP